MLISCILFILVIKEIHNYIEVTYYYIKKKNRQFFFFYNHDNDDHVYIIKYIILLIYKKCQKKKESISIRLSMVNCTLRPVDLDGRREIRKYIPNLPKLNNYFLKL